MCSGPGNNDDGALLDAVPDGTAPGGAEARADGDRRSARRETPECARPRRASVHECGAQRGAPLRRRNSYLRVRPPGVNRLRGLRDAGAHDRLREYARRAVRRARLAGARSLRPGRQLPAGHQPEERRRRHQQLPSEQLIRHCRCDLTFPLAPRVPDAVRVRAPRVSRRVARAAGAIPVLCRHSAALLCARARGTSTPAGAPEHRATRARPASIPRCAPQALLKIALLRVLVLILCSYRSLHRHLL